MAKSKTANPFTCFENCMTQARDAWDTLVDDLDNAQRDLQARDAEAKVLRQDVTNRDAEIKALKDSLGVWEERVTTLESELEDLRPILREREAELARYQRIFGSVRRELDVTK